jgi:multidrug efflux pump
MSKFFIHALSCVGDCDLCGAGRHHLDHQLPVAQFPSVAPPTITVTATYPGATSETMTDSVLQLIEREMNGAAGLMYMESKAPAGGQAP